MMDMAGAGIPLRATYDGRLVVLSLLVAVLGAYTALGLADPIAVTRGRARALWLGGGALALGLGIWGQHFVGMLAYGLPIPIAYDGAVVAVSLVGTVTAAAAGLFLVRYHQPLSAVPLAAASALVGIAVVSLHYTGMAAVRTAAMPVDDPLLLALAVAIAIAGSGLALWLAFHLGSAALPARLRRPARAPAPPGPRACAARPPRSRSRAPSAGCTSPPWPPCATSASSPSSASLPRPPSRPPCPRPTFPWPSPRALQL